MIANTEIEIIDLLDLLSFTLSTEFINKWKSKYGERLLKSFQLKLIESLKAQKPISIHNLHKYLHLNLSYNTEVVINFFKDIDFEIYQPMIHGSLNSINPWIGLKDSGIGLEGLIILTG